MIDTISRMTILAIVAVAALVAAVMTSGASRPSRDAQAAPAFALPACGGSIGDSLPSALPLRVAGSPDAPPITASAAVVIDAETGRVLHDLNAHQRRSPASTTKIMTAVLAIEAHPALDDTLVAEIDGSSMVGSSVMGLRPGVPISLRDLLYGLMLPSGNDAAIEIARGIDGDVQAFVERMNARVKDLGLGDTHFTNPHGLDNRRHYSSAYDLAMIGRYAMANPMFAQIAGARSHHLAPPSDYDLFNGNSLLDMYPGADGIKIGWTNRAGWTLVASAVRDGRRVYAVVLGSDDRNADAAALLDWAFASHSWTALGPRVQRLLTLSKSLGGDSALWRAFATCA